MEYNTSQHHGVSKASPTEENMIKLNGVVVIVEKLFTIIIFNGFWLYDDEKCVCWTTRTSTQWMNKMS